MPEPIQWLADGTPFSPRFQDRYRSEAGGLAQATQVFLQGCGLPAAWSDQAQWRVLETGFGLGLNFLVTWQAWRLDARRPRLLHFVSTEAFPVSPDDLLHAVRQHPELRCLAEQLGAQWHGLMPGVHRLVFENGQVLLTLGVGDAKSLLKAQNLVVDSVYLDGFSPQRNPDIWDLSTLKAVARCCRRGTRLASWTVARSVLDGLQQCGFEVRKTVGVAPKRDNLQACFNPTWAFGKRLGADRATDRLAPAPPKPARCVVVGAGLAGAACAASLARRGWQVSLIDAVDGPAGGASALPAGLLAPHVSPDDSLLSKLTRSGLRATWQTVTGALQPGLDFQMTGVLQRRFEASGGLPAAWPEAGHEWSRIASAAELAEVTKGATGAEVLGITQQAAPEANGSGHEATPVGLWHGAGGWIKPYRLVQALLNTPGITPLYGATVARLKQVVIDGHPSYWQVLDSLGNCLAEAELVVLAAGFDTARLVTATHLTDESQPIGALPLQAIRGQVAWGKAQRTTDMPPFPVNGHGSFIPGFMGADGQMNWLMGATFERDNTRCEITPGDQHALAVRLQTLLPRTASTLESAFQEGGAQAWAGVRCASPDRLPVVGPLNADALPGVWVCSALGSRGLTFAVLCAELLASWLHAEPLPIENRLAQALRADRFQDLDAARREAASVNMLMRISEE